jgi:hypothetical protein
VNVAVTIKTAYVAPVAGTANAINGTNGSVEYTITITKGNGAQAGTTQSIDKTVTITATKYVAPSGNVSTKILGIWEQRETVDGEEMIYNIQFNANGTSTQRSNMEMMPENGEDVMTWSIINGNTLVWNMEFDYTDWEDEEEITVHYTRSIHATVAFSNGDRTMAITLVAMYVNGELDEENGDVGYTMTYTKVNNWTAIPITAEQYFARQIASAKVHLREDLERQMEYNTYSTENLAILNGLIDGLTATNQDELWANVNNIFQKFYYFSNEFQEQIQEQAKWQFFAAVLYGDGGYSYTQTGVTADVDGGHIHDVPEGVEYIRTTTVSNGLQMETYQLKNETTGEFEDHEYKCIIDKQTGGRYDYTNHSGTWGWNYHENGSGGDGLEMAMQYMQNDFEYADGVWTVTDYGFGAIMGAGDGEILISVTLTIEITVDFENPYDGLVVEAITLVVTGAMSEHMIITLGVDEEIEITADMQAAYAAWLATQG